MNSVQTYPIESVNSYVAGIKGRHLSLSTSDIEGKKVFLISEHHPDGSISNIKMTPDELGGFSKYDIISPVVFPAKVPE